MLKSFELEILNGLFAEMEWKDDLKIHATINVFNHPSTSARALLVFPQSFQSFLEIHLRGDF